MDKTIPNYYYKPMLTPSAKMYMIYCINSQQWNSLSCNPLGWICAFTYVLFLDLSKATLVKTVVEEIDQRGKVLSSRVQSIEEKRSKMANGKTEQRVSF